MPPAAALNQNGLALDSLLKGFLESVTPTTQDYSKSRTAAENVIYAMRRAFYPLRIANGFESDFLVVGSVGKRTALAPITMVDVLYVLPRKLVEKGPTNALNAIWVGAHNQFESADLSDCDIGVAISADGLVVRVVPASETKDGYLIPTPKLYNKTESWMRIHPVSEAATLRLSDKISNGRTRQLLTLLKSWRNSVNIDISSLGLEILVQEFLTTQIKKPRLLSDFKSFVAWARSCTPGLIGIGGSANQVYVGESWHAAAKAAFWRATLAENAEPNDVSVAAREWRNVLGERFPVPEERTSTVSTVQFAEFGAGSNFS